jgi:hypothetical protein
MVLLAVLLPGYGVQAAETAVLTLSCDGTVTRLTLDGDDKPERVANIVCRQSMSDSWLGNLRECLAHLV